MSYEGIIAKNKEWIDQTFAKLDKKLSKTAVKSRDKIPYTTVNGEHDDKSKTDISWWTNGFWGGLMWLMYSKTKNEDYRLTAEKSEQLLDEAFTMVEKQSHDTGFIWHILSGASYKLTGNKQSRNRDLIAAMILASRYNVEGNYIRSWNGKDQEGWTIIDCMMNIPMLYWAAEETNAPRYKKLAIRYADMAMKEHVRADGSVNHIVVHDPDHADVVIGTKAGQGYAEGSCWSRGASWALYGFVLSYIHTKEQKYLDTAKKVANYFIANVSATDWLPLLDFRQPETPVYYDSTAGAIAACGLIEIAKHTEGVEQEMYLSSAIKILKAMEKNWCDWTDSNDSILQMGSERYGYNMHIHIIYGDYFFTEAILKLTGSDFLVW